MTACVCVAVSQSGKSWKMNLWQCIVVANSIFDVDDFHLQWMNYNALSNTWQLLPSFLHFILPIAYRSQCVNVCLWSRQWDRERAKIINHFDNVFYGYLITMTASSSSLALLLPPPSTSSSTSLSTCTVSSTKSKQPPAHHFFLYFLKATCCRNRHWIGETRKCCIRRWSQNKLSANGKCGRWLIRFTLKWRIERKWALELNTKIHKLH